LKTELDYSGDKFYEFVGFGLEFYLRFPKYEYALGFGHG
jgi:hypothetical protein